MAFVYNDTGLDPNSKLLAAKQAATASKTATIPKATSIATTAARTTAGLTGTTAQHQATTPAATAPAAPTGGYNGLSTDQYKNSLVESVKAGVMTEYEANAAIIKNNLAKALSDLQAERSALEPLYQNQLTSIAANQFATGEGTKEVMNQGGWNASNSGLAIGEQTKIANAADKSRADAFQAKTTSEGDINRRTTLANDEYGTNLASLEAQKNAKISGAEADALVQADNRNRQVYESDRDYNRSVLESDRAYALQRAAAARARSSGSSSSSSSTAKPRTTSQSSGLVNDIISIMENATKEEAMATYNEFMMDPDASEYEKNLMKERYSRKNQDTISTFYNP